MKERIESRFDEEFDDGLRDPIRYSGNSQPPTPPAALGICTCLTGGRKYDLEDIRFHSLYRFSDRFASNRTMVSSSMPAEPRLAFTCWYASHTVRLAMQ